MSILETMVKLIEKTLGDMTMPRSTFDECQFNGQTMRGEHIPAHEKPAAQLLLLMGVDPTTLGSLQPRWLRGLFQCPPAISINGVPILDRAVLLQLMKSAKIYLNPALMTKESYLTLLAKKNAPHPNEKSEVDGLYIETKLAGVCLTQQIHLLLTCDRGMDGNIRMVERKGPILHAEQPIVLLQSPRLDFERGTIRLFHSEQQRAIIKAILRNVFNATLQEERKYLVMSEINLGVFNASPDCYFDDLIAVVSEFPDLNVIYYPGPRGLQFSQACTKWKSPENLTKTTINVILLASLLSERNQPCALYMPTDIDLLLGVVGPGKHWYKGTQIVYGPEAHLAAISTAPLAGRGLNPGAYETIVVMQPRSEASPGGAPSTSSIDALSSTQKPAPFRLFGSDSYSVTPSQFSNASSNSNESQGLSSVSFSD